jgi:hypothetical protein
LLIRDGLTEDFHRQKNCQKECSSERLHFPIMQPVQKSNATIKKQRFSQEFLLNCFLK